MFRPQREAVSYPPKDSLRELLTAISKQWARVKLIPCLWTGSGVGTRTFLVFGRGCPAVQLKIQTLRSEITGRAGGVRRITATPCA